MQKFHLHITAESIDDLKIELHDAAYILTGLLNAINEFDDKGGGFEGRQKKTYWKKKANEWKDKNKIVYE